VVCPNEGFMKQLEQWHQLCVFELTAEHVLKALAPHLNNLSSSVTERICGLISDYVAGTPNEDSGAEKEELVSLRQKIVAEMATMLFKVTHTLQGIPYQNEIIPGKLWLGQLGAARSYHWLHKHGITRVCSVTQWGKAAKFHEEKGIGYHVIHIEDKPHCYILDHLDDAVSFIETSLMEGHRLLVHCNQGRSRSATVLTAFLIKTRGCRHPVAYHVNYIKKARPEVCPNEGFMKQLEAYRGRCILAEEVAYVFNAYCGRQAPKVALLVSQYFEG